MPRKKKEEMPAEDVTGDISETENAENANTDTETGECESAGENTPETASEPVIEVPEPCDNTASENAEIETEENATVTAYVETGEIGITEIYAESALDREAPADMPEKDASAEAANALMPVDRSEYDPKAYKENIADHESGRDTDTESADDADVSAKDSESVEYETATREEDAENEHVVTPENAALPVPSESPPATRPAGARKTAANTRRTITNLDLKTLDRNLSEDQMREWNAIYASYRAKSVLTGKAVGADETAFNIKNRETGETERKKLTSLIVIEYRVKVLIPESEMWMPGEERPSHVIRNMTGSTVDYVVMEVDREGECAIGSRRVALAAKRHFFAKGDHREGELMKCRVIAVGAKQCTVECHGFDIRLTQRDLSYTAVADLREKYRPGQELPCLLKSYVKKESRLEISVKEVNPNPFLGADIRHPIGSRRQAVISGKYGGGVFCTLPDDTVCLCLYSAGHADADFKNGDSVIIVIRQYDYARQLIYGRILSKW
jgi:hypothetical protein